MKQKAKREVLKALKSKMRDVDNGDLMSGGMGVSVQAEDKKGLIEGLEKAKEIADSDKIPESPEDVEELDEEIECPYADLSKEEIEAKIEMLQELLAEKES